LTHSVEYGQTWMRQTIIISHVTLRLFDDKFFLVK